MNIPIPAAPMDNSNLSDLEVLASQCAADAAHAGNISFSDLFDISRIQGLQDAFAEATGVASIIIDTHGESITRPSSFTSYCQEIVRKSEKGLAACLESRRRLGKILNPAESHACLCVQMGLWHGGASIMAGDRHVANWLVGQVRTPGLDTVKARVFAKKIGVEEEIYLDALRKVPEMSWERFQRICVMLSKMAEQLSVIAFQNLQRARRMKEREAVENALRDSEENLRITLNSIGEGVVATDGGGRVTRMNPAAESLSGWDFAEAVGRDIHDIFKISIGETKTRTCDPIGDALLSGVASPPNSNAVMISRRGASRSVAYTAAPIRKGDKVVGAVMTLRDITERQELEEQLSQSMKMDSLGRLAGGVAHDFNNLLVSIIGYAELLETRIDNDEDTRKFIANIIKAGKRAGELTGKLLAFSRKSKLQMVGFDINETVKEAVAILERSLDPRISIKIELAAESRQLRGDPGQILNSLINLGVNARDAMLPKGGMLMLRTENVRLDSKYCQNNGEFEIESGPYVKLSIRDTGEGIPPENLKRIFEPFFTTKKPGMGTGLGLSAVFGMVKAHKGTIHVYSEIGAGTVFNIYLPMDSQDAAGLPMRPDDPGLGRGRILIVDDDPDVREIAHRMLEDAGYDVVAVPSGEEALESYAAAQVPAFDVVLLDLAMPGMNGVETLSRLASLDSMVKVVVCSGFNNKGVSAASDIKGAVGFVIKPFQKAELVRAVQSAIVSERSHA